MAASSQSHSTSNPGGQRRAPTLETTTWKLTVAYDGTHFHGWQRQLGDVRTVQGELEAAIAPIANDDNVFVRGAGRTDAGVHARGQVASVRMQSRVSADKLLLAMSARLPPDLSVVAVDAVAQGFSAKKHSVGKHYRYAILNRPARDPFLAPFTWHQRRPLDLEAMRYAAAHLVGEHDFESFRSVHCDAAHARRYVWAIDLTRDGDVVNLQVRGNAFCRNMVRVIAGTLVEVGRGQKSADDVARILLAKDRTAAGMTAPAQGLFLDEVYYPDTMMGAGLPADATFPGWPPDPSQWPPPDVDEGASEQISPTPPLAE